MSIALCGWRGVQLLYACFSICVSDLHSCFLYVTSCITKQHLLLMFSYVCYEGKYYENYNNCTFEINNVSSGHTINHSFEVANL
jgi:hypothetical protein